MSRGLSWAAKLSSTTDSGRVWTDDYMFRKPLPSYAYSPTGLQGSLFKVMAPVEGDVTFFQFETLSQGQAT